MSTETTSSWTRRLNLENRVFQFKDERGHSGTAELRFHNQMVHVVILLLVAVLITSNYLWFKFDMKLSEQQWIVYQVDPAGHVAIHPASDFRTPPTDEEIQGRAWDVVRWLYGASTESAAQTFWEAERWMTPSMQFEFEKHKDALLLELKNLQVYNTIENPEVHLMSMADLPPDSHERFSRYDVIVSGTMVSYRNGSHLLIGTKPFCYRLHLVPTERRTKENYSALLVDSMVQFELPKHQTNAQAATTEAKDQNQASNSETVTDKEQKADTKTTSGRKGRK